MKVTYEVAWIVRDINKEAAPCLRLRLRGDLLMLLGRDAPSLLALVDIKVGAGLDGAFK